MADAITEAPPEKVTRRDLAEGKIEKVLDKTDLVPVSADSGSVRFEDTIQMANTAKLMATAGPMLPAWLQGNVGGCFGIIMRATELRISPLALAEWSYVVEKGGVQRVSYMSAFFRAIIELRAPIKEHTLKYEILGEGDARRCKVWATFKDELEPREFISEPLSVLRPKKNDSGQTKGSPLWDRKPEVQMYYDAGRDWARINTPSLVAGMYTPEELKEHGWEDHVGADNAKDVTPTSGLKLRLGAAKPERAADLREHVNAAFNEQQSAADVGKESSAAETAEADELESPAAAEGATTTSAPRHPVVAPTNSAQPETGGAALSQTQTADNVEEPSQPHGNTVSTGVSGQVAGATTITEPSDLELQAAFDRGKADRAGGKRRKDVPSEYTSRTRLALQWVTGFNEVPGGKR